MARIHEIQVKKKVDVEAVVSQVADIVVQLGSGANVGKPTADVVDKVTQNTVLVETGNEDNNGCFESDDDKGEKFSEVGIGIVDTNGEMNETTR